MSTLIPVSGVLQEPTHLKLPDANVNDVLALAAETTRVLTVVGIIIVNDDSAARVVNIWRTEDSTDYLIYSQSVASATTVTKALEYPLMLYAKSTARKIKAQAESANANTVTVTLIVTQASQSGVAGAG